MHALPGSACPGLQARTILCCCPGPARLLYVPCLSDCQELPLCCSLCWPQVGEGDEGGRGLEARAEQSDHAFDDEYPDRWVAAGTAD